MPLALIKSAAYTPCVKTNCVDVWSDNNGCSTCRFEINAVLTVLKSFL